MLCYTPNDPAQAAELVRWGVDGIITDAVDAIRRLEPALARYTTVASRLRFNKQVRYAQPLARFTALSHPAVNSAARSRVIAGSKRRSTRQFARMSSVFFQ